jgi:drug/metabolite transporter (DMT)-like permease
MFSVGIIILLPLILGKRNKSRNPLRWVGIAWFVIIFGAALAYSLLREPILQYNILIFNYPFLIMAAFSLFKNRTLSPWQNALVVAVILFVGTSSLIFNPNKLIETSEKTATIQQTNFPTSKNCLFLRPNSINL